MATTIVEEKIIEHPLEATFDIEPCTTLVEREVVVPDVVQPFEGYDEKDDDIENKIEEIYDVAMSQVTDVFDQVESVEGKYKAKLAESAASMLNIALGAVREKSQLKQHKDRMRMTKASATTPHTLNQNLIVADRNEILKTLFKDKQ